MALSKLSSLITGKQRIPNEKWVSSLSFYIFSISFSTASKTKIDIRQTFFPGIHLPTEEYSKVLKAEAAKSEAKRQKKIDADAAWPYLQKILKLEKSGANVQQIEVLCEKMKEERCLYSDKAFAKFISSFWRNLTSTEAFQALHILQKNSLSQNMSNSSSPPNSLVYCNKFLSWLLEKKTDHDSVILYLCEVGRFDLAFDQFKRGVLNRKKMLLRYSLKTETFEELILGLFKKKMVNECMMVLDEMFELKCTPTDDMFYIDLIPFVSKANEPYKVVQLFRMMEGLGYVPLLQINKFAEICIFDICQDTVASFCNLWKFDDAANFLLGYYDLSETTPYRVLLKRYCYAGMVDEAVDFLDKMIERGVVDFGSWTVILKQLCEEGESERAFEFFQKMISWYRQEFLEHESAGKNEDHAMVTDGDCLSPLYSGSKNGDVGDLTLERFKMLISCVWTKDTGPESDMDKLLNVLEKNGYGWFFDAVESLEGYDPERTRTELIVSDQNV